MTNFATIDFMLTYYHIIHFETKQNKGIFNASSTNRKKSTNHSTIGGGKFNAVNRAHCGMFNQHRDKATV